MLAAMAMVVIVGFVALATDVGLLWSKRRQMQTAADAAAVAGMMALRNSASITSAANTVATLNGFTNGANSAIVTVNNPPVGGLYAGNLSFVEVVIAQPEPTYFLRVLGHVSVKVSTRAVSGFANGPACVYALNPSAHNAIAISGGSSVTTSCGVLDNSNASQGLVLNGGSSLTASSIGVVGNYTGSGYTPTPKIGVVS
jgi:Putative Flp pilus-assembly TadE/G-like